MLRILIADDHAVVRAGLKQILAEAFPKVQFRESATVPGTLESLRDWACDLVVLDLFMPGGSGLELLCELRRNRPGLPVLVLSTAPEDQFGVGVLRAGAKGYLNKQVASEHLVHAARKILEGGKYVGTSLAEELATEVGRRPPLHESLSAREFQIVQLIVKGRSLKEIAGDLALSVKTIRTYRARALEKLELQSDVDLVHYALKHLLVEYRPSSSPTAPKVGGHSAS